MPSVQGIIRRGLLLAALLLAACGAPRAAEEQPPAVAVSTQPVEAAKLAALDLQPLLLAADDGLAAAQVSTRKPYFLDKVPPPARLVWLNLQQTNLNAGTAALLVYNSAEEADLAFKAHTARWITQRPDAGLGEVSIVTDQGEGLTSGPTELGITSIGLATFRRCSAIVDIRMLDLRAPDGLMEVATAYARRVDARLAPAVCEPL